MKLQKLVMDMLLPMNMIIIKSFPFYVELIIMFSVKVKHCIVRLWLLGLQFRTTLINPQIFDLAV